jgi:hypothetical protein
MGKSTHGLKQRVKALLPETMLTRFRDFRFRRLNRKVDAAFSGEKESEVFANVYKSGIWGRIPGADFYSGSGSHDPEIVGPYVTAVVRFLSSLAVRPSAVDMGCGDFNVGRQIRPFCDKYIACDIVSGLIDHNRASFRGLNVDFRCVNAVLDDLPDGDVIFLRQVLQHMSNDQIVKIISKLHKYRFVVITESVPAKAGFVPNLGKKTGPGMRIANRSGVVVTEPPFSLSFRAVWPICALPIRGILVRTIVYELTREAEA